MSIAGQVKKRKRISKEESDGSSTEKINHLLHSYLECEAVEFRKNLLEWFTKNKRDLPWRQRAVQGSLEERVYSVLVSEVMLQQTQVNTVIAYYQKWMAQWPTFGDLAGATPEQVNEMWSGLGYYARGKRLQEAAKEMSKKTIGIPCSAAELQKSLPGVGRYTASAVASIVFGEKVAAVDGNVIRVLSRHRVIGADSSTNNTVNEIWKIADDLIDPQEPGKFNEAMMELGAVVCTPKAPKCSECPVRSSCLAYKSTKVREKAQLSLKCNPDVPDIESVPGCSLCLPVEEQLDISLGVLNYPRKGKKAPPRKQVSVVWILQKCTSDDDVEYFMVKRPDKGLLGNLWEFPCHVVPPERLTSKEVYADDILKEQHGIDVFEVQSTKLLGSVLHEFSHIHQTYVVFHGKVEEIKSLLTSEQYQAQQWISKTQFETAAVSTAMRKVFALLDSPCHQSNKILGKRRIERKKIKNNSMITSFFKPKNTEK
ncbi:hypothetical protein R5R35_002549 [Gryllus longicercus]|uniref:Adenine DNA glycosylase n=1 Tax=Gryllus longicercus TaxID=2509291 RepID=A0AAN9Z5D7_9ORTH